MYIVNWATVEDFVCHQDDGGVDDISELAQPAGVLLSSLDNIAQVLEYAYKDMKAFYMDDEDAMPECSWLHVNKHHWVLIEDATGDTYAVLIIAERMEIF